MKSRTLMCSAAITLFAALAIPVSLAAQEQQNKQPPHYTIKVLGTLGGTFSQDTGLNNRGSVAGFSSLSGEFLGGFASGFAPVESVNGNKSIVVSELSFRGVGYGGKIVSSPGDFKV